MNNYSRVTADRTDDYIVLKTTNFDDFKTQLVLEIGPTEDRMRQLGINTVNVDFYTADPETHNPTGMGYGGPILSYPNSLTGTWDFTNLLTTDKQVSEKTWIICIVLMDLYI